MSRSVKIQEWPGSSADCGWEADRMRIETLNLSHPRIRHPILGNNDRDFQHGVFSTTDDHPWDRPQLVTSRDISFNKAFAQPPNIVCWINSFSIDDKFKCRVKTHAKDITRTGFTLYISTWEDSLLYFFDKTFQKVPLVLAALNMLDFDIANSMRIKTLCTNVTEEGMTWHLDTWEEPIRYAAGASYLAIQDY
ncbi:hypothetical protein FRB93_007140 [Tulasnella sp. JGI-2019a]|nr:hypothetical protein FRB93_007140 [Tulasnella sp. JGI-2019a]